MSNVKEDILQWAGKINENARDIHQAALNAYSGNKLSDLVAVFEAVTKMRDDVNRWMKEDMKY